MRLCLDRGRQCACRRGAVGETSPHRGGRNRGLGLTRTGGPRPVISNDNKRLLFMSEILVADIGGSKSRFALVHAAGRPERVGRIENDTVANLEAAVADYLQQTEARPQQAIFAV